MAKYSVKGYETLTIRGRVNGFEAEFTWPYNQKTDARKRKTFVFTKWSKLIKWLGN